MGRAGYINRGVCPSPRRLRAACRLSRTSRRASTCEGGKWSLAVVSCGLKGVDLGRDLGDLFTETSNAKTLHSRIERVVIVVAAVRGEFAFLRPFVRRILSRMSSGVDGRAVLVITVSGVDGHAVGTDRQSIDSIGLREAPNERALLVQDEASVVPQTREAPP